MNNNNKIKVLFIIDTLEIGGAEQSLVNIAINFKNVTPVFLHVYKGSTLKSILIAQGIKVISLDITSGYHFKKALKSLVPIIERINPDIIHTTLYKSDILGRKLKKHFNVPLVNSLVNNSYIKQRYTSLDYNGKLKLYIFQLYDRYTSRNVDLFISNSRAIQNTNSRALNIPSNKIEVIHRGRDVTAFNGTSSKAINELKSELGVLNKKVLINVSRLLPRKGQLDLLKSFEIISNTNKDLVLLIAGEGFYRNVLQDYIAKNNLEHKIFLLGNRGDIPELLELSDIFVFPSWYEGLPGALIEAMMAKIPIVASNIPENLECVTSEEAIIFKKGDIDDLAKKITWSLQNPKKMIEMAKKAHKVAVLKFEISKISDHYEKVYEKLISNK